jgi:hypothetical protein
MALFVVQDVLSNIVCRVTVRALFVLQGVLYVILFVW